MLEVLATLIGTEQTAR
jgi:DNA replication protein DnaC